MIFFMIIGSHKSLDHILAKLKNGSYKKLKIESVFVQPDVKGWLVFSCIVPFLTVSLINGMRGQKKKKRKRGIITTWNTIESLKTVMLKDSVNMGNCSQYGGG